MESQRITGRRRAQAVLAAFCSACTPSSSSSADIEPGGRTVPPPIHVSFEQRFDAFEGDPVPSPDAVFSMMLGDMDLDGDLDYFLNRHQKTRMEVFENVGGSFVQINRKDQDRSGVYENAGIPDIYGDNDVMLDKIEALGSPGVYVWRGPKGGPERELIKFRWQFYFQPDSRATPMPVRLIANGEMKTVGLPDADFTQVDEFTVDIHLEDSHALTWFDVDSGGTLLEIEQLGRVTSPTRVGPALTAFPNGRVSIWRRDPHGMALVDVVGSLLPDLYVTHGGVQGELMPPHDPKIDQLFEQVGSPTLFSEVPRGTIPSGYGRGRRVAWYDVDGDGLPELYTSNRGTPNTLYDLDSTGSFVDRAPELGIDFEDAVAFAWLDLDGDGWLDLAYLEGRRQTIAVAYNRADGFVVKDGGEIGLVLPLPHTREEGLFDLRGFHVVDIDRDGDLDLWITSFNGTAQARVYRRLGHGFVDVTDGVDVAGTETFDAMWIADVDNDGWVDVVTPQRVGISPGSDDEPHLEWWRNLGGERYERARLDKGFPEGTSKAATVGDVDNDGWIDIVVMTRDHRQLLLNTSVGPNRLLEVRPDLPLGTVIRAYYDDGTVQAWQWGAATVSSFSQSLQPLRFGLGPEDRIVEIGVQLPGQGSESYRVGVPEGATALDI